METPERNQLTDIYRAAATKANADGIKASDEVGLVYWIRSNCSYREDTEFFLVLGIGWELADIQAREQGYDNEVDRAFTVAIAKHPDGLKTTHIY